MDRKIKIIYLINDLKIGGSEKQIVNLANKLINYNYEIMIITLWDRGELKKKLDDQIIYKSLNINNNLFFIKSFFSIINKFSPDIIHSRLFYSNIFLKISRFFIKKKTKVIYSQVSSDKWRNIFINYFERFITFGDYYYTVNSESSSKLIQKKLGVKKERIKRLNNLITGDFKNIEYKNKGKIGFLGRFHKAKGADIFVNFIKKFKINNYLCYFAGDENNINGLDRKKVFWNRYDVETFFSNIDILILTSRWEGMPNSIIEGAFYGKVVIIPENLFKNERLKKYILEYKGEKELCDIINKLNMDKSFFENSAIKLQTFIKENHSIDNVLIKYNKFYTEIIGEKK